MRAAVGWVVALVAYLTVALLIGLAHYLGGAA